MLFNFSKDVSRLRARYLSTLPRGGVTQTVLFTDIPGVGGAGLVSKVSKTAKKMASQIAPADAEEGG